jgi:hypothetical protein
VKIAANDAEAAEIAKKAAEEAAQSWDTDALAKKAAAKLPSRSELSARFGDAGARLAPLVFDVDGAPCCADFVAACANLRARNYGIPEAAPADVRRVAGKIVGGVVTTAAAAAALSCAEILKLGAHGEKGTSDGLYRGPCFISFVCSFDSFVLANVLLFAHILLLFARTSKVSSFERSRRTSSTLRCPSSRALRRLRAKPSCIARTARSGRGRRGTASSSPAR